MSDFQRKFDDNVYRMLRNDPRGVSALKKLVPVRTGELRNSIRAVRVGRQSGVRLRSYVFANRSTRAALARWEPQLRSMVIDAARMAFHDAVAESLPAVFTLDVGRGQPNAPRLVRD